MTIGLLLEAVDQSHRITNKALLWTKYAHGCGWMVDRWYHDIYNNCHHYLSITSSVVVAALLAASICLECVNS